MSILNYYRMGEATPPIECLADKPGDRYSRDALGDLKHGLDLIFALKGELDKLHPLASETLIRLLSY